MIGQLTGCDSPMTTGKCSEVEPRPRATTTMLSNECHEITCGLVERLIGVVSRLNGSSHPASDANKMPACPINGTLEQTRNILRVGHEAVNEIESLLF